MSKTKVRIKKINFIFFCFLLVSCSQPDSESLKTSEIRSINTVVSWGGGRVDVETSLESTRNRDAESKLKLSGGDYLEVETAMGLSGMTGAVSQVGVINAYAARINLPENILDVFISLVRSDLGERSESFVTLPEPFNVDAFGVGEFSVSENVVLTWSPANPGSDIIVDISPRGYFLGAAIDGRNTLYRQLIPDTGMYEIPLSSVFADMDMSVSVLQRNHILLVRENSGTLSSGFDGGSIAGYQVRGININVSE